MASISQVLSSQQGPYKWGVRDCLLTAQAVIQSQGLIPPDYSRFHQMEESVAIRSTQKIFGSMLNAHTMLFQHAGLKLVHNHRVGDILLLEGNISSNSLEATINVGQITRLGFVTNNYEIWTWFDFGLYPVHKYDVKGIFSCRH